MLQKFMHMYHLSFSFKLHVYTCERVVGDTPPPFRYAVFSVVLDQRLYAKSQYAVCKYSVMLYASHKTYIKIMQFSKRNTTKMVFWGQKTRLQNFKLIILKHGFEKERNIDNTEKNNLRFKGWLCLSMRQKKLCSLCKWKHQISCFCC